MIWTGETLEVEVVRGPGKFSPGARRVLAIKESVGKIDVLVVDDSGSLAWVQHPNYKVVVGRSDREQPDAPPGGE